MTDGMNRRGFLKVLGATGGGAVALSGCSDDAAHRLIPYLVPPENQIPGTATYYATTCRECSAGCGMHVKVREGRAIKLEGSPESPINRGKLCASGQAGLQGLYNPDRVRSPMRRGSNGSFTEITWDEALADISGRLASESGDRIAFVSGNESGTFDALIKEWLRAYGSENHVAFEALGYEALRAANREVFGVDSVPEFDLENAHFVISFGADFLETWVSPVEHARKFTAGHAYSDGTMGRYVHVDPRLGQTAISADEWIAPRPGTEGALALAMAHVILRDGTGSPPRDVSRVRPLIESMTPEAAAALCEVPAETIERLAREFVAGPSVALGGGMGAQHGAADSTAVAVNLLNYVAGNVGRTVRFTANNPSTAGSYADLNALREAIAGGRVGLLFVHGADPVYHSAGFSAALDGGNVGLKVSFSSYFDDTASRCDLILPDHHPLEQWNDFRPRAGAYLLQQPMMQPVFDTRQTGDVLLQLAAATGRTPGRLAVASYKDYLQQSWQDVQRTLRDRTPFADFWNESLQHGGRWQEVPVATVRLAATAGQAQVSSWSPPGDGLTLIVYPTAALGDGRGANKPWLRELPDPISKMTWGNWVEMSPARAAEMGVSPGDYVTITSSNGNALSAAGLPVFVYPGIRDDVVAMPMGHGHAEYGRYASDVGVNASRFLHDEATVFGGRSHYASVTVEAEGGHERLAQTAGRNRQMGRGIAQGTTLSALLAGEEEHHGGHAAPVPEELEQVVEQWQEAQWDDFRDRGNYAGEHPRWAMAIDLSRCTGCNACVTACYAENNLPVVGKEAVQRGREMSWLRIERYFEGGEGDGHSDADEPFEIRLLPMMCQQCGNAPCEPVCPVFAAYHTPDGLNGQVYNRCVGTRYCANNCPYKVRYFNYFDYQNPADSVFSWPEPLHWQLNPDVTVRSKGVMEKCTFCVQRIRGAQHTARLEDRELADGEITTACQQTCPAEAITFGDLNDPASRVSQLARDERAYHVLDGLNTYPGVTYLKQVRNRAEA